MSTGMMTLAMTDAQLASARAALLGPQADALIHYVVSLNLFRPLAPGAVTPTVLALAQTLGWTQGGGDGADKATTPTHGTLTRLGQLVSTSLREYSFWLERDRQTHGAMRHPALAHAMYQGKDVVEVGSGYGCNLFSLQGHARRLLGIEPTTVYRQLSPILAEREGRPAVEIVFGLGEKLPLADASFDVVICYSSCQYMDTRVAFADMARVLKPGGQLQVCCGVFDQVMSTLWHEIKATRSLGLVRHAAEVLVNTLSYQYLGRRALYKNWQGTTDAPIYAQESHQAKWMEQVGLRVRRDLTRRDDSDCFMFADKPL